MWNVGMLCCGGESWCWMQIMKSDEDVRMISAEAPVLFAKVRSCSRCLFRQCFQLLPSAVDAMIGTSCAVSFMR